MNKFLYGVDTKTTDFHGTVVASLLVGAKLGAAPRAAMVSVAFPRNIYGGRIFGAASALLDGLSKIGKDIRSLPAIPRGMIVNFSQGVSDKNPIREERIFAAIQDLINHDVVFVVSTGNNVGEAPWCSVPGESIGQMLTYWLPTENTH